MRLFACYDKLRNGFFTGIGLSPNSTNSNSRLVLTRKAICSNRENFVESSETIFWTI